MRRDGEVDAELTGAQGGEPRLTQPLGNLVYMILVFVAAIVVTGLVGAVANSHVIIYGFGHGSACTHVSLNGLMQSGGTALAHMRPATFSSADQVNLCANQPTMGQRLLVTLGQAPSNVFYLAVLMLLWQLLRAVRREGPFALVISQRLRFLAWFILVGSLTIAAGQEVAKSFFAATIVTDPVPIASNAINAVISGLFPPLIIACGLLTLARVIRVGVRMNDDLAGTV
jgi:hypothetical protein